MPRPSSARGGAPSRLRSRDGGRVARTRGRDAGVSRSVIQETGTRATVHAGNTRVVATARIVRSHPDEVKSMGKDFCGIVDPTRRLVALDGSPTPSPSALPARRGGLHQPDGTAPAVAAAVATLRIGLRERPIWGLSLRQIPAIDNRRYRMRGPRVASPDLRARPVEFHGAHWKRKPSHASRMRGQDALRGGGRIMRAGGSLSASSVTAGAGTGTHPCRPRRGMRRCCQGCEVWVKKRLSLLGSSRPEQPGCTSTHLGADEPMACGAQTGMARPTAGPSVHERRR
jgi:hypothetical protein